jgi:hypothetical protein
MSRRRRDDGAQSGRNKEEGAIEHDVKSLGSMS